MGAFNLVQLMEGVEGYSLALFTRVMQWTPEEVQALLGEVRRDIENKDIHAQNEM